MESIILKKLKSTNPDKEYPSNIGQRWTDEEEITLLDELNKNIDIEIIAQNHNRTIGGINSRCREIAYKMYLKNISMEEIIEKTKLDETNILLTIDKKKNYDIKIKDKVKETKKVISIENEIFEMKNEIKELKSTIKELIEMIKLIYEFVEE
jgi:hypothetical protein